MSDTDLRDAYRAASRPRSRTDCPPSSRLVEYAAASGEDPRLADHLADCSACAEEFHALRTVLPEGRPTVRTAPANARAWQFATAAMLGTAIALGALTFVLFDENRALRSASRRTQATATVRTATIERRPPDPVMNVAILDLLPRGAGSRGGEASEDHLPANAEQLTAILNLDGGAKHADYGLEIVNARGNTVWQSNGMQRSPNDTFTLHLSRRYLSNDTYQLKLYGIDGPMRVLMETYSLDLR